MSQTSLPFIIFIALAFMLVPLVACDEGAGVADVQSSETSALDSTSQDTGIDVAAETQTDSDASTGDSDAAPKTCSGTYVCGCPSDVGPECVGGVWFCAGGEQAIPADQCGPFSCSMWGGEVCCDSAGNATDAMCYSPSQPYCPDDSAPQTSCTPAGDGGSEADVPVDAPSDSGPDAGE